MARQGKHRRTGLSRLRAVVQAVCLAVFVYLAVAIALAWQTPVPYDLFLRFDPLVWLVGSVASREMASHLLSALALVAATAWLGRMFCGWVCPLGTVIDGIAAAAGHKASRSRFPWLVNSRFWILAGLVGAALAGANLAGWLDPLVMSSRALLFALRPEPLGIDALLAWSGVAAAVALTYFAPRFWCRTLCPLGTALSLVARAAPVRREVAETCSDCGACSTVCPMGQSLHDDWTSDCIACRRCEAACPQQAVGFAFKRPLRSAAPRLPGTVRAADPQPRRRVLLGLLFGWGGIGIGAAAGFLIRAGRNHAPLRPPGTTSERRLAARCVGCGACLAVCPTGGLVPLLAPGRLDAVFTPQRVPRVGPCLPECTACGEACPTGAIPKLPVAEKAAVRMGTAVIDRSQCLPWARGERCVICLDACPAEYRAIELRLLQPRVFRPFVHPSRCTGCGICEHRCPLEGDAAIRVIWRHEAGLSPRMHTARDAGG